MSRVFVGATPLEEAWERFAAAIDLHPLGGEEVPAAEAGGRVTAGVIRAVVSSPHYHASAMDGYALRAAGTYGASERALVRLRAVRVDTGDPLPAGCDAVVPLEDAVVVRLDGDAGEEAGRAGPEAGPVIEIRAAVHPWHDVRVQGEDIVAGQVLFGPNHRLAPADVALLLTAGVARLKVRPRPAVTFIPTGDELVGLAGSGAVGSGAVGSGAVRSGTAGSAGVSPEDLEPGRIIESNGTLARLTLESWGALARVTAPAPDDPERLGQALDEALASSDLVLVGAGSSAGRGDFTARVVAERGRVVVHGVALRPGKPVVLGVAGGKPVVGLPGYPVSCALALELFVRPIVFAWQGLPLPEPEELEARLGRSLSSPLGLTEFVRVKVARLGAAPTRAEPPGSRPATAGRASSSYVAVPLPRGAGLASSLSRADGTIRVPASREGLEAGETVTVRLSRSRRLVDQALLVSGSHDLLLDLLAARLAELQPGAGLASGPVGSVAGLLALRDGLCHLAGTHLLDEETGEYNRPWVERLLPGRRVILLTLARRQQGLMVRPGNPKKVEGLADLLRPGVVFVNRQRGSGTRVLLDYLLRREGLLGAGASPAPPSGRPPAPPPGRPRIEGYQREEGSHLGVASAVASGAADVGLGVAAAARALGLDFIPVAEERYDLAYLPELEADPRLDLVRRVLRDDPVFRAEAAALGGYALDDTGKETIVSRRGEPNQ